MCGKVKYRLLSTPKKVSHCHCKMCQKQHGAAFATYASLPKQDLVYVKGQEHLQEYNSSGTVVRTFCRHCGSSLQWGGSPKYPDWTSVALGTLDTEFEPEKIINIYAESKACWLKQLP